MKKVAIIGTQGVPARYGGFETLVENMLGENASSNINYTVFCSSKDMPTKLETYKNARLRYIPLHANGIQSIPYDILSMIKAAKGYDTMLILGVSGCLFLPLLRMLYHRKLIVNIDGLEHKRAKWGKIARKILKMSEAMALKYADIVIADNKGIQNYVYDTYFKPSVLIAYGGDHVKCELSTSQQINILQKYGVEAGRYGITICRIEPENNCHVTLEAFAQSGKDIVFIGNWMKSNYSINLYKKYYGRKHIHLINSLYDKEELYALRNNCKWYIHGHSAGGTNPSLVEAMFFKKPILAFDVIYNRETTHNKAFYFKDKEALKDLISLPQEALENNAKDMMEIAEKNYQWKHIAELYEKYY